MSCCPGAGRAVVQREDVGRAMAFEIEYSGGRTVTVVGPATGRRYTFSGIERLQCVDRRDAGALLRQRAFRLKRLIRAAS